MKDIEVDTKWTRPFDAIQFLGKCHSVLNKRSLNSVDFFLTFFKKETGHI